MLRWLAAPCLLVVACGSTIDTSGYDTSCQVDEDCVAVQVGDICSCTCQLGAINQTEWGKYVAERERIGQCRDACGVCPARAAYCNAGTCAMRDAPGPGAADAAAE